MISVIVPVYNEEKNILTNVRKIGDFLKKNYGKYEIIIVDDCSSDDTFLMIENENKVDCKVLRKTVNQGKGLAIRTGIKFAKGDLVCIMDSDLQIKPEEVITFLKVMDFYQADAVIGNKRHTFSNVNYSLLRKIVSNTYNIISKILFGFSFRDTQCGLKIFKKPAIDKVIDKIFTKRFAFDLELLVALRENNFRIADSPVTVSRPLSSRSIGVSSIINTAYDTFKIWYRKQKGYYAN